MMKFKLRVKDLCGNWHVHRFETGEAAYRHWTLYIEDGSVTDMQMWKLQRDVTATGEPGEEVWYLSHRYSRED